MTVEAWPTLGPQVCDWIEETLPFGPGPLEGQPYGLRLDQQALIWASYELYPQGHPLAGRRRYSEVYDSEPKGCAKTELAAGIGAAELDGPVRCDGFDAHGAPVGVPVFAPDIPFLATTMDQAQDLAFARARFMLEHSAIADRIDAGEENIYLDRGGKLYVVTAKARSKDGYIPTFAHADETHLFVTPELLKLFDTVWRNLNKRPDADPWGLQTTTAFLPGEGSVAELTYDLARQIAAGEVDDTGLLFAYRHASDRHDLATEKGLRAAIAEAYGPAAEHLADVEKILRHFRDPRKQRADNLRYWLNLIVKGAYAWLSPDVIKAAIRPGVNVGRREPIAIGFDGSLYYDATALIGCRLSDGHLFVIGVWERPQGREGRDWKVPKHEVDQTLRRAINRDYDVVRVNCDKHWWQDYIDDWHADFGDVIVEWDTRRETQMSHAVERLETSFNDGETTICGHPAFVRHLENTRTRPVGSLALRKDGRPPVVLRKEHPKSPLSIDCAVAAVLAKEAAHTAIGMGALKRRRTFKLHAY